jgi:hypothetical protein
MIDLIKSAHRLAGSSTQSSRLWSLGGNPDLPSLVFSPDLVPLHCQIQALKQFNRDTRVPALDQAPWSANPLVMLWPETDAAFATSGDGGRRLWCSGRCSSSRLVSVRAPSLSHGPTDVVVLSLSVIARGRLGCAPVGASWQRRRLFTPAGILSAWRSPRTLLPIELPVTMQRRSCPRCAPQESRPSAKPFFLRRPP